MSEPVICPNCEATNGANAQFCGRCGWALAAPPAAEPPAKPAGTAEAIPCLNCGRPNPAGTRFCHHCGVDLARWKPARRSRRGLWLRLLLLVLGLAAGAIFLLPALGVEWADLTTGWPGGEDTPEPTRREEAVKPTAEPDQTIVSSATGLLFNTDLPTLTPFPTGTPRPTLTPLPPGTTSLESPILTPTPITPTPAIPAGEFNPVGQGAVHVINQPWEQDGISLTARSIEIRSAADRDAAAARVWFRLVNNTGDRILIEIDWNNTYLEDSFGTRYIDYYGGGTTSEWVEAGENYDFDRYYSTFVEQLSRIPSDSTFIQVVVDSFSRVANARWQYDINPTLRPMAPPEDSMVKSVGEAWGTGGVTLQLTDLRVHDDRGGNPAAQAWFVLTNPTNQAVLVDVDYGRIFILDSFGRRFGDWDGGGVVTHAIDPGRSVEFNRYYSDMSGRFSRVTRSADFVALIADRTAGQGSALWLSPINRRLSDGVAPNRALPINQPWEQDGVSLTARTIEIRGQDNRDAAAARVWYRLVNKTGQRLLVDIDWSSIHLEDNLGNVYGDFYGQQLTSVWVESGATYDFDRYYSEIVEQQSRIPANAKVVTIVVDTFSYIKNARWQRIMAPELVEQSAPAEDAVQAIGDGWEANGLLLRLTNLEVRSESDRDAAAFRAWFDVVNTTSQPILTEIDFGHIFLTDSFGGRFGDWEGGGLITRWIGPGERLEFDRYYSEMAGQASRIARGSQFVLVRFENLAGMASGMWQMDIAR